jgi:fatty acid desaturase
MSAADFDDAFAVDWYRVPVERQTLSRLMARNDWRGWLQTLAHLGLFLLTAALAYAAFLNIAPGNGYWSLPLLLLALFVRGTIGPFMGLIAIHELQHRTERSFCRNASTYAGSRSGLAFWSGIPRQPGCGWFAPGNTPRVRLRGRGTSTSCRNAMSVCRRGIATGLGFYYRNMQYHLEHHMYPAVPFYNLPKLRAEIESQLPPAPHGLIATWREILDKVDLADLGLSDKRFDRQTHALR